MEYEEQDMDQSVNESTEEETSEEQTPNEEKDWQKLYENQKLRAEKAEARLKETRQEDTPKKKESSLKTESNDIDYGNLAFYNTKSNVVKIEADDDIDFLKKTIEETGKPQQVVLNSKWFQAELAERREAKATEEAIPTSTKRSSTPTGDDVGILAEKVSMGKMTLKDIKDHDLRIKVTNQMINQSNDGRPFYNS